MGGSGSARALAVGGWTGRAVRVKAGLVGGAGLLMAMAFAADRAAGGTGPQIVVDLLVGGVFLGAAGWSPGSRRQRMLLGAVGVAWLLGSVIPATRTLHQAVLMLALLGFPTARLRGAATWLLIVAAAFAALAVLQPTVVAALFVSVALVAAAKAHAGGSRPSLAGAYPTVAAVAVGVTLAATVFVLRNGAVALITYEFVLIMVAAGHVVATVNLRRAERVSIDSYVMASSSGLAGLVPVLQEVLRDPGLRIDVGVADADVDRRTRSNGYPVAVSAGFSAVVWTDAASMKDVQVRRSVLQAIRLVASNEQLRNLQAAVIAELAESRRTLQSTIDVEREAMAIRLQGCVAPKMISALARMPPPHSLGDHEVAHLARICRSELQASQILVRRIITDTAPSVDGTSLEAALRQLVAKSAVPVSMQATGELHGDVECVRALFYSCSEAIANSAKHAGARAVHVVADGTDPAWLTVAVTDDGRGGADAAGQGLAGLADRLAVVGGQLKVTSARDQGTCVVARAPRVAPS